MELYVRINSCVENNAHVRVWIFILEFYSKSNRGEDCITRSHFLSVRNRSMICFLGQVDVQNHSLLSSNAHSPDTPQCLGFQPLHVSVGSGSDCYLERTVCQTEPLQRVSDQKRTVSPHDSPDCRAAFRGDNQRTTGKM